MLLVRRSVQNSAFPGLAVLLLLSLLLSACDGDDTAADGPQPVVVYSSRLEHLIKPLFDRFTEETGIPVSYVTDAAGPLLARLQAEGKNTAADMLMTVDAGNLWQAEHSGLLTPVQSPVLTANVPSNLHDPDGYWYALTIRARTIVYSTERVDPKTLSTYEDLAKPQWSGRLCLRTSKKVYNQSLVATMISSLGMERSEEVVNGWVENLALEPFANDVMVMEAILAGQCDVGLVNTYYFGRMQHDDPDIALALFWPNQTGEGPEGRGVHLNISGAGVTKYAKHKAEATQLIEWLSGVEAQKMLMSLNLEYPVNAAVEQLPALRSWGEFKHDDINVSVAGKLQADAVKLMDRAGYR